MRSNQKDIRDSLSSLPTLEDAPATRRVRKKVVARPVKKRSRRWIKRLILFLLLIVLTVVGYLGVKAFVQTYNVFNGGSILSLLLPGTPLKTDSEGRTNILLFGTSQDDPAHQNADGGGGLWLTDSIQLISIDQQTKTIKMIGIPRDLWVQLDNCSNGTYGKINSVYECAAGLTNASATSDPNYASDDATGATHLMQTVESVTGIMPQYYIHANYGALKQAVDAVGGIDVSIAGDGASGIYDTNFDWDCPQGPYTCKNVYYPSDGAYHLNGAQALYLARARGDAGLYSYKDFGLNRGDFDRQANQQKILSALQAKMKSASVIANPFALSGLLDAFGNNVTTSLSGGEIKTLLTFSKKLPANGITPISLVSAGNEVVTTSTINGQSVVIPTSGTYDYSSIIDYLAQQLTK